MASGAAEHELCNALGMPRRPRQSHPWESELLRLGRRLVRDAATTGTQLALGGFESIESALSQAVAPATDRRRLRLVADHGRLVPDCLAGE
jgi:hypothetical protein